VKVLSTLRMASPRATADGQNRRRMSSAGRDESSFLLPSESLKPEDDSLALTFAAPTSANRFDIIKRRPLAAFVDLFKRLRERDGASFEYVVFPNRATDIRLAPVTVVVSLNLLYCLVLLIAVMTRLPSAKLSAFDQYQVLYYVFLNSTAVGSLAVDSFMRARLLRRRIMQDAYVRVTVVLLVAPVLTHCIPGGLVYGWAVLPVVVVSCVAFPRLVEGFLNYAKRFKNVSRTRMFWREFIARSIVRILLTTGVCAALSMSYNYAALFIYRNISLDSSSKWVVHPDIPYWQVPRYDYESRTLQCVFEEMFNGYAATMQHAAPVIGIF